jgi:phage shock protein A
MTNQERILLEDIRLKLRLFFTRQEKLKEEKAQLQARIDELEQKIAILKEENSMLEKKYENLKLAKTLAGTGEEDPEAKKKITKIVREIDKCIALLNQ